MARNARSITARAVPWVALVLVAIFAFAQVRARREAEREASVVSDPGPPDVPAPPARVPVEDPVRLAPADTPNAEWRLEQARRAFETEMGATRRRTERIEALHAVAKARANALADELAVAIRERAALVAQLASPKQPECDIDETAKWVADVESGDKPRLDAALKRAAEGTQSDVDALIAFYALGPGHEDGLLRLVAAFPLTCDLHGFQAALVGAATTEEQAARRLRMLPAALISDADAVMMWLALGSEEVTRAVLASVAARPALSPEERAAWSAAAAWALKLEGRWQPAVRAIGILRLGGHISRLVRLAELKRDRAVILYALSRVPDLEAARSTVEAAMARFFQEADNRETRTAVLLLAERLLGESLDWDPSAPKEERDKALEPILKRFPE